MPESYSLIIKSEFTEAEKVLSFVESIAQEWSIADSLKERLKLALSEAATNAILHGNLEDPHKKVTIRVFVDDRTVIGVVEDEGDGFDPKTLPDPVQKERLLKPGGRGIFLIEQYCDKVDFEEDGNVIRLTFHR